MEQTWLAEHTGPYVVFKDNIYPAHSDSSNNNIIRKTASGKESPLGLKSPIPLSVVERNFAFGRAAEREKYIESILAAKSQGIVLDHSTLNDRLLTLTFLIGHVLPQVVDLKSEDEVIEEGSILEEMISQSPQKVISIDDTISTLDTSEVSYKKMPALGPNSSPNSLLGKLTHGNNFFVADGYMHILQSTMPLNIKDVIQIEGEKLYWTKRFPIEWVEAEYLKAIHNQIHREIQEDSQAIQPNKQSPYLPLVNKDTLTFRNATLTWQAGKCIMMIKKGAFARQDVEEAHKWHPKEGFSIGGAFYFNKGELYFGEDPLLETDFADISYEPKPFGKFKRLCARNKPWRNVDKNAQGVIEYLAIAQNIFYNGFDLQNIKNHERGFGAGTYREIYPLDQAVTFETLDAVRDAGYEPCNIHLEISEN